MSEETKKSGRTIGLYLSDRVIEIGKKYAEQGGQSFSSLAEESLKVYLKEMGVLGEEDERSDFEILQEARLAGVDVNGVLRRALRQAQKKGAA